MFRQPHMSTEHIALGLAETLDSEADAWLFSGVDHRTRSLSRTPPSDVVMGVPQNGWLRMETPMNMDDLGIFP